MAPGVRGFGGTLLPDSSGSRRQGVFGSSGSLAAFQTVRAGRPGSQTLGVAFRRGKPAVEYRYLWIEENF